MVGKTLSHYRILEELGRGGMGIVYRAEDYVLSRAVALKVLPPKLVSPEDRERFLREAQAAAALNHPNIATIYDFGETDEGQTFIVMELVEGEALSDRIRRGPLDASDATGIFRQMAEGLAAAHDKGIVHRDIKPSNTMLTEDGRVKILDFGLAKLAGGVDLTKTGSTLGTMAYMSPEQVQGQMVDHRTDLWALGVALYEMLTGEKPFAGAYEAAVVYGIVNQPVDLGDTRIPDEMRPVLDRLLTKEPEQRLESATQLLDELDERRASSVDATSATVSRWLPRSAGSSARRVLAISFVVVLAVAVLWSVRTKILSGDLLATAEASVPTVAVMYIQNDTPRERLGFNMRDMLAKNLVRVKQIHTLYNQRLKDILYQELGEDMEAIDPATATRIARDSGIDLMVTGSVVKLGPEFILQVDLVDVDSGDILAAESATAVSAQGLQDAVNRITSAILLALGDLGEDVEGPLLIQDVSTASLTAYELYERGTTEFGRWQFERARKYFEDSIEIDSTFVAAYIAAASLIFAFDINPTNDLEDAREFLRRGRPYLRRATEKEKAVFEAIDAVINSEEDRSVRQRRFRELADAYPDDKHLQLAAAERGGGETALRYLNRALDLDPSFADAYNMMAYQLLFQGQDEKALSTVRRYRAAQPDNSNSMDSAWEIMTAVGETDEVIRMLNRALEDHPEWRRDIEWRKAYSKAIAGDSAALGDHLAHYADTTVRGMSALRDVALALGQWQSAQELAGAMVRGSYEWSATRDGLKIRRDNAAVLHANRRHDEAERLLEEAVSLSGQVYGAEFNPFPVLAAYQNGLGYADAGNRTGLVEAIDRIDELLEAPGVDRRHLGYSHLLKADLVLMDGDLRAARAHLDSAKGWNTHYHRLRARVEGLEGNAEEALSRFRRTRDAVYLRTFAVSAYPSFFIDHAVIPYEIARMFDQRGDRAEAIRRYEEALREWEKTGADFYYVDLVRDRLRELK